MRTRGEPRGLWARRCRDRGHRAAPVTPGGRSRDRASLTCARKTRAVPASSPDPRHHSGIAETPWGVHSHCGTHSCTCRDLLPRRWALPCPDLPLRPHPKALELGNDRLCSLLNSYKEILFFMWPRSGPGDSKPSVRALQEAAAGPFRSSVLGGTRSRCDPAADVSPPCVFPASVFYSNELRVLGFVFF